MHAMKSTTRDTLIRTDGEHTRFASTIVPYSIDKVWPCFADYLELQEFMLANDSVTVAVEVPVTLDADDLDHFRGLGYHVPITLARNEVITGHIDIVQIRYGLIHILDYKPGAKREKPIEQLTIYALALSRLTGINLYHFKCAWFDGEHYYDFYPRAVVRKASSARD